MTITEKLLADGWRQHTNYLEPGSKLFCKSFPGHAECSLNDGKNKQVEVYHNKWTVGNHHSDSWSVKINGELLDGEWIRLTTESIKDFETIARKVNDMLKTWDFIHSITEAKP